MSQSSLKVHLRSHLDRVSRYLQLLLRQLENSARSVMSATTNPSDCECLYNELSDGSEFLSQILPWEEFSSLRKVVETVPVKISLKSIAKLLVETVYLWYYMQRRQLGGYLSRQVLLTNQKYQQQQIKAIFVSDDQQREQKPQMRQFIKSNFVRVGKDVSEGAAVKAIEEAVDRLTAFFQECRMKNYVLQNRFNEAIIKMEFDEFFYVYYQILKPKMGLFKSPSQIVRTLEQTRLFRQNSLLLKFTNNSILVKVLSHPKCSSSLREIIVDFEKERMSMMENTKHEIYRCQSLMEDFFRLMVFDSIMQVNISLNQSVSSLENSKKEKEDVKLGKVNEGSKLEARSIVFTINTEEKPYQFLTLPRLDLILASNDKAEPEIKSMGMKKLNQFQIHYWVFTNQLIVKLNTNSLIKFQELDSINIILSSLNNLHTSFQYSFEQNNKKLKANDKCLVFWMHITLHPKEHPFISILQTIDKLLIYLIILDYEIKLRSPISPHKKEIMMRQLHYLHAKLDELMDNLDIS